MATGPEIILSLGLSDRVILHNMTGILGVIAREVSIPVALEVAWKLGGRQIYIGKKEAASRLIDIIGEEAFQLLSEQATSGFGGSKIDIPAGIFGARSVVRLRGLQMMEEGASIRDVTDALRVSRSAVKAWKLKYLGGCA
jgi:hypothetical protein